jgi:hypothetical protein
MVGSSHQDWETVGFFFMVSRFEFFPVRVRKSLWFRLRDLQLVGESTYVRVLSLLSCALYSSIRSPMVIKSPLVVGCDREVICGLFCRQRILLPTSM